MKRVLVTGASGFIGHHCLEPLLSAGYKVHAADISIPLEAGMPCEWHRVDLFSESQVTHLLANVRPTHLLHFAWYAEPGKYWTSLENFHWVRASLNLFEQFYNHGGKRLVAAGTCAEYDWNYGYCSESITPLSPSTTYGICKHSLRIMLDAFSLEAGLSSAWGRIFFLYGPHEHPGRLVASVIHALLAGRPALCSHGNQIRDFLHVADVASAFVALLESDVRGAINIASGKPVAIKDLVFQIARQIGREDLLHLGAIPVKENDPPVLIADIRRLSVEVGWRPTYGIDEGIINTIENIGKHRKDHLPEKEPA